MQVRSLDRSKRTSQQAGCSGNDGLRRGQFNSLEYLVIGVDKCCVGISLLLLELCKFGLLLCLMLSPEAEILGAPVNELFSDLGFYVTDLIVDSNDLSSIAGINDDSLLHLVIVGVFTGVSCEHDCCFVFETFGLLPLLLGQTLLEIHFLRVSADVAICILNKCLKASVLAVPLAWEVLWGKRDNIANALGEIVEDLLAVRIDQNFCDLCLELLERVDTSFE